VKTASILQVYVVRRCKNKFKKPIKTHIHKQEPAEYSENKCREFWENYV